MCAEQETAPHFDCRIVWKHMVKELLKRMSLRGKSRKNGESKKGNLLHKKRKYSKMFYVIGVPKSTSSEN